MYESESEEEYSESEFYYPDDTTSEDLLFTDENQRNHQRLVKTNPCKTASKRLKVSYQVKRVLTRSRRHEVTLKRSSVT
jgi:hypothetical protein